MLKIIFLILFTTNIFANNLHVDSDTKFVELLSHSKIYVDKSRSLKIKNILNDNIAFKENTENLLGFGFSPELDVWIKFTLTNNSNFAIRKILEYDNTLTTDVEFFDPDKKYIAQKDGLSNIKMNRRTLNPIFNINLKPNETKTYYIKASSYVTTLIVKVNIWCVDEFYENEIFHQLVLALFFGAMSILGIYNLFIFFFTKDISYLFYFFYVIGLVAHHAMYVGIGSIYVLNQAGITYVISSAALLSAFPIFMLALFTKTFLHVKQYKILNKILNIFIIIFPLSVMVFTITDEFNKYRNILPIIFFTFLFLLTLYAAIRKNRQAYYILIGWFSIFLAITFMLLSSLGVFSIYQYFPYYIELFLVFEALIFSVALADRIKQLQKDKEIASQKLIIQQENEKQRLTLQVEEQTKDLKISLDEKKLLLKELHHRVKNNMQTMVSLIRLQKDKVKDEKLKDVLVTIKNRVSAMSHLHELLYQQDNISSVNTYEYFDLIVVGIKESYDSTKIKINIKIDAKLRMEDAIYCGLILNELVTNSFKYAFLDNEGDINIHLMTDKDSYILKVSDNGIGYDKNIKISSLGITLVNILATKQLKGSIKKNLSKGVHVEINWPQNGQS